jgi:hypothetical protein
MYPYMSLTTLGIDSCPHLIKLYLFLQEKAVDATKQKEEQRKKPKPEEQEGRRTFDKVLIIVSKALTF